jgi:Tir chaperone protein (CesT) family
MAQHLHTLLEEWSTSRDLDGTEAGVDVDAEGKSYLTFDGDHEVALSQLGDAIYLESDLAPIPGRREAAEALIERLLKLQLASARTGHEVLSLAADGETLTLFRVLSAGETSLASFQRDLGDFVSSVAFFASKLAAAPKAVARPGPMNAQFFVP